MWNMSIGYWKTDIQQTRAGEDCLMWFDVCEPAHVWAQLWQVSPPPANQRRVCRLGTNQRRPSVSHPAGLVWEEASISVLHSEKIGRISAVSRTIPRFLWQGLSDSPCWVHSIKYWVRWSSLECWEPTLVKMTGSTQYWAAPTINPGSLTFNTVTRVLIETQKNCPEWKQMRVGLLVVS